jgi:hypothetical protein
LTIFCHNILTIFCHNILTIFCHNILTILWHKQFLPQYFDQELSKNSLDKICTRPEIYIARLHWTWPADKIQVLRLKHYEIKVPLFEKNPSFNVNILLSHGTVVLKKGRLMGYK